MPRRDGTGPNGMGSRSGRGLGMCTGVNTPRFGRGGGACFGMGGGMHARNGCGFGFQGGRGNRGDCWWGTVPTYGSDYQVHMEERATMLEEELRAVLQRIANLEKNNAT